MLQISEIIDAIENKLKEMDFPAEPAGLYDPFRYMLSIGGKRIRPSLSLMASNLFSEKIDDCVEPALAPEVFHNFSLIHDDIMDNAMMRRGMQSVHEKWDLNTAILSGDAMLVKSYELLMKMKSPHLFHAISLFNDTAIKVCEGQQLDMDFEKRKTISTDDYIAMITKKTAVLLGCSLYCGAVAGGSGLSDANLLYDAGVEAGISFQIKDDMLDLFGDESSFGKKIGGDILQHKKTYLFCRTIEIAEEEDRDELLKLYGDDIYPPDEKINRVKSMYEKYHIGEEAALQMQIHYGNAVNIISKLSVVDERKEILLGYLSNIYSRTY